MSIRENRESFREQDVQALIATQALAEKTQELAASGIPFNVLIEVLASGYVLLQKSEKKTDNEIVEELRVVLKNYEEEFKEDHERMMKINDVLDQSIRDIDG